MLLPAKEDLLRRRWIWQALSDLFLDDEITEDTLQYIARIAAECGYTQEDLESIYRREVAPAVGFNLLDAAGTWGYFDTVWLEERILRPSGSGSWLDRWLLAPLAVSLLRSEWKRLRALLEEQRGRVRQEQEEQGSQWKPCWTQEAPCYRWQSAEQAAATGRPRE